MSRRYPWPKGRGSLEYMVLHCVEDAAGCMQHFQWQIERQGGGVFSAKQVSGALQRLKAQGLVANKGSFWSVKP